MKESYDEGLASHIGPESCGCVREDAGEALTGVRAGWVSNPERSESVCRRAFCGAEGHTAPGRKRETWGGRRGITGLKHARKHPARRAILLPEARPPDRKPGDPWVGHVLQA